MTSKFSNPPEIPDGLKLAPQRKAIPYPVQRKVVIRSNGTCETESCELLAAEFDHIVPVALGGKNTLKNIQHLCHDHHLDKTKAQAALIAKARRQSEQNTATLGDGQTETQLQTSCFQYLERLRLHGQPLCFVRTNPNATKYRGSFKVNNGMPDLMGSAWGLPCGFEIKKPGQELRESQIDFKNRWEFAGGRYFTIRSLVDLDQALDEIKEDS